MNFAIFWEGVCFRAQSMRDQFPLVNNKSMGYWQDMAIIWMTKLVLGLHQISGNRLRKIVMYKLDLRKTQLTLPISFSKSRTWTSIISADCKQPTNQIQSFYFFFYYCYADTSVVDNFPPDVAILMCFFPNSKNL